jgi:hypothetical protein
VRLMSLRNAREIWRIRGNFASSRWGVFPCGAFVTPKSAAVTTAEDAESLEQKQALIVFEKELSEPPPQEESFPGSCARSW